MSETRTGTAQSEDSEEQRPRARSVPFGRFQFMLEQFPTILPGSKIDRITDAQVKFFILFNHPGSRFKRGIEEIEIPEGSNGHINMTAYDGNNTIVKKYLKRIFKKDKLSKITTGEWEDAYISFNVSELDDIIEGDLIDQAEEEDEQEAVEEIKEKVEKGHLVEEEQIEALPAETVEMDSGNSLDNTDLYDEGSVNVSVPLEPDVLKTLVEDQNTILEAEQPTVQNILNETAELSDNKTMTSSDFEDESTIPENIEQTEVQPAVVENEPLIQQGGQEFGGAHKPLIHKYSVELFFGENVQWDYTLLAHRKDVPVERMLWENRHIVDKYGMDILVDSVKYTSGPNVKYENAELLQLYFSLKRNMAKGPRVPIVGIPLGSLVEYRNSLQSTTPSNVEPPRSERLQQKPKPSGDEEDKRVRAFDVRKHLKSGIAENSYTKQLRIDQPSVQRGYRIVDLDPKASKLRFYEPFELDCYEQKDEGFRL